MLAERECLGVRLTRLGDQLDFGHAVGQAQRRFERIGESPLEPLAQHQSVDDDLDLVLLVARQALVTLEELVDDDRLTVDPGSHVALSAEIGEQGVVLALASAHDRSQHLEPGPFLEFEDPVDDLLRGLALQPRAVIGAVLDADPGVQQAQVVIDLGDRADR